MVLEYIVTTYHGGYYLKDPNDSTGTKFSTVESAQDPRAAAAACAPTRLQVSAAWF